MEREPTMDRSPAGREPAIEVHDLGIRYDLRLTKRTTLKGSLAGMLRRNNGHRQPLLGAPPLQPAGSTTASRWRSSGRTAPARARSCWPSPGSSSRPRARSPPTAGYRHCSRSAPGFEMELTGRDNIDLAGAFLGIDHKRDGRADAGDHRVRRHRPVHRRTGQDLLDRDAGPARASRSRRRSPRTSCCSTRSWEPATQTFRARSQARVQELVGKARAIVLVTHDLTYVAEFCNRAILLGKGRLIAEGEPDEIVELYRDRARSTSCWPRKTPSGSPRSRAPAR